MEPKQSDQGNRFDPETIARYVNEEHAETMRDLADMSTQEQAYENATTEYGALAAQITPEQSRCALRELEELRDSEGYIE